MKNPYLSDNSYKLAGGGIMSTIVDLGKFSAAMSQNNYFTSKGLKKISHSGSHPNRAASLLNLKSTDGEKQCIVLMTNTNHKKVKLGDLDSNIRSYLKSKGIWK